MKPYRNEGKGETINTGYRATEEKENHCEIQDNLCGTQIFLCELILISFNVRSNLIAQHVNIITLLV